MADPDAATILQDYLDAVAQAVMADDWPGYRAAVLLPCHLVSHLENKMIQTEADLRQGYDQFRDTLRFHGVTDYIRLVQSAVLLEPDLLTGSYVSHLFVRGHRIMDPALSQMTLRHTGSRWCAVSITGGIANSRWSLSRPVMPPHSDPKEGPTQ